MKKCGILNNPMKPAKNNKSIDKTGSPVKRAPIVVVMGHIDHGKSTLLDYIRKSHIVDGEAGGITQHMGAYQAEHISADGIHHAITFLDTPGHEAFCNIRERGAHAADIAILVVSAEDGVKPQTIEAYNDIKAEKMPYIVAINKIDKPNADIDRAKQSLGEHEIYVEGWGGDIPNVPISALKGTGIPELLDMVILMSELADLKTDTEKNAQGLVIESTLDNRKGISATLLIKDGTLPIGVFVVAGDAYAPVRYIEDFKGTKIVSATASMPVKIIGWTKIPDCGSTFTTVATKKDAEKLIQENIMTDKAALATLVTSTEPVAPVSDLPIVSVPLIVKADVIGSLQGIQHELEKIKHDRVHIKIVSEGIGDINENDVKTAMSDPEITVIGFNASPDKKAASLIERSPVNVKTFNIIYELTEYVRDILTAKIPKEFMEESTGTAKILAIFSKEKDRQVIGGKVETGTINTGNDVKVMRRGAEIGRGKIRELQEKKQRTSEVAEGHEFGLMVEAKVAIAVGDRVEAVRTIEKK